ncbi:MAG: DUF4388 domain-containing protein [Actinobacteria bacterium]|nr:DUF4388 domain-containing protein [Actinomycetota bacterium]
METRLFESKELKVVLSGNLGFVSLDEVLRLLTRSNRKGSVDVTGQAVRGRIFVTRGGVALATTSDDEELHLHLIKSGLVDEDVLLNVASGETTLAAIVEKNGGAMVDLLRETTVESVYQLGLNGDSFDVEEGEETRYASPKPFDVESIIDDAKQRLADWAEVSNTVSDLDDVMNISRDLGGRDEVSINRDAWRVISVAGSGSSVVSIAGELGTSHFWVARIAADLIDDELLVVAGVSSDEEVPTPAEDPISPREPEAVTKVVEEDVDPDESWWEDPEDEAFETDAEVPSEEMPVAETVDVAETDDIADDEGSKVKSTSIFGTFALGASKKPAAVVKEELSQVPTVGEDDQAGEVEDDQAGEVEDDQAGEVEDDQAGEVEDDQAGEVEADEDGEVEEDTEAFLEKVFSELDSTTDDEEEGYGLLRRRRMGVMRDSSRDG